jgi:hypothetical protein
MIKTKFPPFIVKSKPVTIFFAGLLCAGLAKAQQSVSASSGNATGGGGSLSYSIGQAVYTSNSGSSGNLVQGIQQAYEIFLVSINETDLSISLKAFPNPIQDNLTLLLSDYTNEQFFYQLIDTQGKLLIKGKIVTPQTQINTAGLLSATYFINVVNKNNKNIQSFKIIKN